MLPRTCRHIIWACLFIGQAVFAMPPPAAFKACQLKAQQDYCEMETQQGLARGQCFRALGGGGALYCVPQSYVNQPRESAPKAPKLPSTMTQIH